MNQNFKTTDLSNRFPSQNAPENNSAGKLISGVGFDEKQKSFYSSQKNIGWITKLIMKTGWAKNEKEATVILLILFVVIFLLAFLVWPSGKAKLSEKEMQMKNTVEKAMRGPIR